MPLFIRCLYLCCYLCVYVCKVGIVVRVSSSSECKDFQDDWKQRKINIGGLKIPVIFGTVLSIRCEVGYEKLSGSDAVTCLENTTFDGLNDVSCLCEYSLTGSRTKARERTLARQMRSTQLDSSTSNDIYTPGL